MAERFDCITSLTVSGFRSFAKAETISPAVPSGARSSGLTILVGPNGGGKSALLEAFHLASRGTTAQLARRLKNDATDHVAEFIATWTDGSSIHLRSDHENPDSLKSVAIPTLRNHSTPPMWYVGTDRALPNAVGPLHPRELLARQRPPAHSRDRGIEVIASRMRQWGQPPFADVLAQITNQRIRHSFDTQSAHVRVASDEHDPTGLGYGICSACHTVDALYDAPDGSLVLIDEPEISLHPKFQRRMVELFAEKSKRLQLIITTHSPYFVNWQCILEGARLIRVFRDESQRSRVCTLSVESMNSLGSFLNDVNNPHVLGLNASEAVFLNDRVVLVEGQEDVICYQKAAAQIGENLEADFFGWGVGGAPKMALIARLLQDLGYTRVAGILDGDKEKELQELRSQFASFSFFGISAANVRDKKKDGKVIRGLCDTACSMHPGSTDEFTRLFRDIKGALAR